MATFRHVFLGLIAVLVVIGPVRSSEKSAGEHTAAFQSSLLSVMKDAEKLGVKGRYDQLKPIIEQTFHLPLMAGLSAGEHWQKASPDERKLLVDAFTRMSAATLATLFSGYSGEVFKLQGQRSAQQGLVFVDTKLEIPGRDSGVPLTYVAKRFDGNWRIIDVIVDSGISELKVRISEYRQILKTGGMKALIKLLNDKADDLLS